MEKAYIKNATKNDFNIVSRFANNLHQMHVNFDKDFYREDADVLTKEEFEEYLDAENHYFPLIYVKEKAVGMAHFVIDTMKDDTVYPFKRLHVFDLIIDKKYRKNGFGQRMFNYFEKIIKEKNLDIMSLNVAGKNTDAIEFYKKQGMSESLIVMMKKYKNEK